VSDAGLYMTDNSEEEKRKLAAQFQVKLSPELTAAIEQFQSFKLSPELTAAFKQFQSFKLSPELTAAIKQFQSFKLSPELTAAFKQTRNVFAIYGEQMRQAIEPLSQLVVSQEQLRTLAGQSSNFSAALSVAAAAGQFPTALAAEQLIAERAVASARSEGRLSDIVGTSLTIDVASAADEFTEGSLPSLIDFLERLLSLIRSYVGSAQSIADLAHLHQVATFALTAVALWYAMHSATSDDIENLRATVTEAVERQTDVIKQESQSSRQQFSQKLDEVIRAVQQLATDKAKSFGPAAVYKVKRAIPVKAERKMKSQTMGWLLVGQPVFVIAREKKWVEIEFVNFAIGKSAKGWVVKKYLKRL
jgi:hypothetical protein